MAITLLNILKLPEFKNCTILSGKKNLKQSVYRVTVIEAPPGEEKGIFKEEEYGRPGDFNLTGLYAVKDNPEMMLKLVRILIDEGSAALCYIDAFVTDLPKEVLQLADANQFPIIRISFKIPYAEVISGIMEMIIKNQEDTMMELRFKGLMDSNTPSSSTRDIVYGINQAFHESNVVLMIRHQNGWGITPSEFWRTKLDRQEHTISTYGENFIVVLTFKIKSSTKIRGMTNIIVSRILESEEVLNIGISSGRDTLDEIKISISEAEEALEASEFLNQRTTIYDEMGIYKLLIPIRKNEAAVKFAESVIYKLNQADRSHKTDLLHTAQVYTEYYFDITKTAQAMGLHKNSVRYRIERIRELFDARIALDEFNEMLSVALKLNGLIKRQVSPH